MYLIIAMDIAYIIVVILVIRQIRLMNRSINDPAKKPGKRLKTPFSNSVNDRDPG